MNQFSCHPFALSAAMDHGMPLSMMNQYPVENLAMLGAVQESYHMMQPYMQYNSANISCGSSQNSLADHSGRSSKSRTGSPRIPYPKEFVPTMAHVICGRGKKSYGHCGNKNFLTVVAGHIDEYSEATTKQEKSDIVQAIVDILEAKGGFIRLDPKSGLYYKAEDGAGREKTSQALRDCLNHKYKSSKDIKRKNRKQKRLAKQAVHTHVISEKRPSMTASATDKKNNKEDPPTSTGMPPLRMQTSSASVVPPRTVSSTSVDMAEDARAVTSATPMPVSPTPVVNEWGAVLGAAHKKEQEIHLIQELEPLPFKEEEVEKLPEVAMGQFDFLL